MNERHRVPHPGSFLSKLGQRKDYEIGVVCDDDVQRIRFGCTTPPAVKSFVGGTPEKHYENEQNLIPVVSHENRDL